MRPLLFTGDSITAAGRQREAPGHLGHGYVSRLAAEFARRGDARPVVNTGVSGDRMCDLRARWPQDVLAHDPSLVSIYVGINDTWRRYDRGQVTTADEFERDYRAVLETVRAVPLVLVEPFVVPVTVAQETWADDLDPKRSIVAALAVEFDAIFVPLHTALGAAAAKQGADAIAVDGVHPTPLGASLIAEAWLAAAAGWLAGAGAGSARPRRVAR